PDLLRSKTHRPNESNNPKRPPVNDESKVLFKELPASDDEIFASSFERSRLQTDSSSVLSFLSNLVARVFVPISTSRPSLMRSVLPAIAAFPFMTATTPLPESSTSN